MEIKSLGRRTDLIFSRFVGSVMDREDYVLVQTPSNPGYHWGNYIIFNYAPRVGDLKTWKNLFVKEFLYYEKLNHLVFTWDTGKEEKGIIEEFLQAGFEFDTALILTANEVKPPRHINDTINIRKLATDKEWESVIRLQLLCVDPKFKNDYFESFKRRQFASYKKIAEAGIGNWFGAFLDNQLIADLGIFYEGPIARFQNVETHPDFRGQGICGSLVYQTAQIAFNEFAVDTLVMEADANYHAASIYESLGFTRKESNHSLSWWKSRSMKK